MKVKMKVRPIDRKEGWWEEHELDDVRDLESAKEGAQQLLDKFNKTEIARYGEDTQSVRVLEDVELVEGQRYAFHEHQWKKFSLVTEDGGYDRMKCEKCGITGKRHGFGEDGIVREDKYKAKVYARCDTSLQHIRRHEIAEKKRDRAHQKKMEFDRRRGREKRRG